MNFCQKCGAELAQDAKFCGQCGQEVLRSNESDDCKTMVFHSNDEENGTQAKLNTSNDEPRKEPSQEKSAEFADKFSHFILWLKNNYIITIMWIIVEITMRNAFNSEAFWIITVLIGLGLYVYFDKYNSGVTGLQKAVELQLFKLKSDVPQKKAKAKELTEKIITKAATKEKTSRASEQGPQPVQTAVPVVKPKSVDAVSALFAMAIFGTSYVGPYFSAELLGMSMGTTLYDILKLVNHTSTLFILGCGPVIMLLGVLIKSRGLTFVGTLINGAAYVYFGSDLYNLVGTGFSNSFASAEPGISMLVAGGVSIVAAIWALIMLIAGLGRS